MDNKIQFNVVKCVTDGNGYCSGKYYAQIGVDNGIHILRLNGEYLHDEFFCTGGIGEGLYNNWDDSGSPSFVPIYPFRDCVEENDFNDYVTQYNQNAPEQPQESDNINHPQHYTSGGIECIDAIEAAISTISDPVEAFLTGQVIKYLWRYKLKNGIEDLRKAKWYLDRLIKKEEQNNEDNA